MKLKFKELQVPRIDSPNFFMSPIELKDFIDFEVKRIYFITQPKGEMQSGAHCHKIEKELFVMIQGTCTAVIDNGGREREISMKGPTSAMYVGEYVWHHFKNFSEDAILLAISSTNYNPNREDYIENYEEYKEKMNNYEKMEKD